MDDNFGETRSTPSGQAKNEEGESQPAEEETPIIPSGPDPDPDPEFNQEQPSAFAPVPPRKRNWKKLIYLLGVILAIVVLFNVVRTLTGGSKSTPPPTPTPIVKETPTPVEESTPEPTINPVDSSTGLDRSELSVAIQNGSGEGGVAKRASDLLKGLGYDVVSTGNADNFDYTDITAKVKATEKKYLPLLIKDLSTEYAIGSSSSDLSASESAEAVVIIGK